MNNTASPTIVVGLDGSIASLAALRWAVNEAVARGSQVEVVNAWAAHSMRDLAFGSTREFHNASICMLDNEVRAVLRDTPAPPVVIQTSINSNPAAALIERARTAEMLVLGAHGHNDFHDIVFGQIEAGCRRHAGCPVVVVDEDGAVRREPKVGTVASH